MLRKIISVTLSISILIVALLGCSSETETTDTTPTSIPSFFDSLAEAVSPSNEEKGVPQQQLENEIIPESNNSYQIVVRECLHDINTELHTDTITLVYDRIQQYQISTVNTQYTYHYNKSSDTWTCNEQPNYKNFTYSISDTLLNTEWIEQIDVGFGKILYYELVVDEINSLNGWIHFTYEIYFNGVQYSGSSYIADNEWETRVEDLFVVNFNSIEGMSVSRR